MSVPVRVVVLAVAATVAALLVVGAAAAASVPQSVAATVAKKKPKKARVSKIVRIKVPEAGNVTVARLVITVKKSKKAKRSNAGRLPGSLSAKKLPKPKLSLVNAKKLPRSLLVVGGVKRTKRANRFIATVIAVNVTERTTASTQSASAIQVSEGCPDVCQTPTNLNVGIAIPAPNVNAAAKVKKVKVKQARNVIAPDGSLRPVTSDVRKNSIRPRDAKVLHKGPTSLPRLGQEVINEFLKGDPDRPLTEGFLHNIGFPLPGGSPDPQPPPTPTPPIPNPVCSTTIDRVGGSTTILIVNVVCDTPFVGVTINPLPVGNAWTTGTAGTTWQVTQDGSLNHTFPTPFLNQRFNAGAQNPILTGTLISGSADSFTGLDANVISPWDAVGVP